MDRVLCYFVMKVKATYPPEYKRGGYANFSGQQPSIIAVLYSNAYGLDNREIVLQ